MEFDESINISIDSLYPFRMTDPDQCIICLESLEPASDTVVDSEVAGGLPLSRQTGSEQSALRSPKQRCNTLVCTAAGSQPDQKGKLCSSDDNAFIATLVGCNHVVHDRCIRCWANNSNTCPICRATFNEVKLSTTINGKSLSCVLSLSPCFLFCFTVYFPPPSPYATSYFWS